MFDIGDIPKRRLATDAEKAQTRRALNAAAVETVIVGAPATPALGTQTGAQQSLRINSTNICPREGRIISCQYYGGRVGSAAIVVMAKHGSRYTVKRTVAITVALGLQTLPLSIPVAAGDVLALWNNIGGVTQNFEFDFDLYTYTDAALPTGTYLPSGGPFGGETQINYTLAYPI